MITFNSTVQKSLHLTKQYFFHSDEKTIAWLLLIGAVISILLIAGCTFLLTWFSTLMWTALYMTNLALFLHSSLLFSFSLIGVITAFITKQYCSDYLGSRWRKWAILQYTDKYLDKKRYLSLERTAQQIDNPAQRIQEDLKSFVDLTLQLSLDFLHSSIRIGLFVGVLWVVGGALSISLFGLSLTIPGYLVWCAILFSLLGNFLTHKIGQVLSKLTNQKKQLEADLRKELEFVRGESENIAQLQAESWHKQKILDKNNAIYANSNQKINTQTKISIFQNFYLQATSYIPLIATAPLIFLNKFPINQLGQVIGAFVEIQSGFSWFATSYPKLMDYQTSISRLSALDEALHAFDKPTANEQIKFQNRASNQPIEVKHVNLTTPTSTQHILRGIDLTFKPGETVLIKGDSGLGKSSLFKVLANTWAYGKGEVSLPQLKHTFFLSQQPLIPHASLRAVLAYPEPENTYPDAAYTRALEAVGGLDALINQLDTQAAWYDRLSGGEKQRIAFCRVLLKKPKWLFMDESTSALDAKHEQKIYQLLRNELKETTFISITHNASVNAFHDRILFLKKDAEGQVTILESQHSLNDGEINLTQKDMAC